MKQSNGSKNFEKKSASSNKISQKLNLDKEFKNLKGLIPTLNKSMDEVDLIYQAIEYIKVLEERVSYKCQLNQLNLGINESSKINKSSKIFKLKNTNFKCFKPISSKVLNLKKRSIACLTKRCVH